MSAHHCARPRARTGIRRSAGLTLAALVPVLLSASPRAQEDATQLLREVQGRQRELVDARVGLIRPVSINGVQLSADQIRREAVFLVGAKTVEAKIAEFFVLEQLEVAIEEGRDKADFEISEDELLEGVRSIVQDFQLKNPGIEFWEAIRAQFGLDKDQFLEQRRQTLLFDKLFFPGPATEWPEVTREAIMASAQGGDGKAFWDNLVKASIDEATGKARELPAFWMQLCRGWVQKQLKSWSDIRYPSDGLDAQFCLAVNDRTLETAAAFDEIKAGVYVQDLERAVTEVVVREALRQELVKAGAYLSDEEFRKEFDEYRAQFDGTPFNTEVIATAFKGYPSLEAFRQRWRLIRSFERMIEKDINDDNLQAHADQYGSFFADGQVNVDVIQILGRSQQTGAWIPGGMDGARQRAEKAMAEIESGRKFDEVKAEYGQYYTTDKEQGRLGSKSLNQLRQLLRESEFTDLLLGYSVGSYLYYDAQPGSVVGPLRSTDAYYIVRVNSRTPARTRVSVADERTRELVRQDYVSHRFLDWANEVMARAEVK
ncbi:MAG: hypothetical protein IPM29_01405 [Planctomycetes bacterium]|nr:hypothetical protein [Planctomycetota bacterium]